MPAKVYPSIQSAKPHITHTGDRPFVCTVCVKAFTRNHDRKTHEELHAGESKWPCKGPRKNGNDWGCGRRFGRKSNLMRHFRSKMGRKCIEPLLAEQASKINTAIRFPVAQSDAQGCLAYLPWPYPEQVKTKDTPARSPDTEESSDEPSAQIESDWRT